MGRPAHARASFIAREGESVVCWYSFSNPRTRCIHWDGLLLLLIKLSLSLSLSLSLLLRVFGLWRVCFPPVLIRPARRLLVEVLRRGGVLVSLTAFLGMPRSYVGPRQRIDVSVTYRGLGVSTYPWPMRETPVTTRVPCFKSQFTTLGWLKLV